MPRRPRLTQERARPIFVSMIWDALFSGHPVGVFSALLQLGAIVFAVAVGLWFRSGEKRAEEECRAKAEQAIDDDLNLPDFWPDA